MKGSPYTTAPNTNNLCFRHKTPQVLEQDLSPEKSWSMPQVGWRNKDFANSLGARFWTPAQRAAARSRGFVSRADGGAVRRDARGLRSPRVVDSSGDQQAESGVVRQLKPVSRRASIERIARVARISRRELAHWSTTWFRDREPARVDFRSVSVRFQCGPRSRTTDPRCVACTFSSHVSVRVCPVCRSV
ncbi:uncharacterized protein LOC143183447 [Calliopsis andreniformis]|uniref:uncharacterized protein LOC143183447 n=1 Tax=Calliopsis andreniformis TaxID=337506 RepID=UPI003FCCBBB5